MPKTLILAAALAGVLCLGSAAALAQTPAPAPAPQPGVRAEGPPDVLSRRFRDGSRQGPRRVVDREQHLKDVLQLRPNQDAALKTYLAALAPVAGATAAQGQPARADSTPERLALAEQRLARQQARLAATRAFYGQLDERQKKAFDAMPLMMGRGGALRVLRRHHEGFRGDGRRDGRGDRGDRRGI